MNWIKGFDRIFFLIAILLFIITTLWVFNDTAYYHYRSTGFEFLLKPNPTYQTWEEEHGENYREHNDKYGDGSRFSTLPSLNDYILKDFPSRPGSSSEKNALRGSEIVDFTFSPAYPVPPPDRHLTAT